MKFHLRLTKLEEAAIGTKNQEGIKDVGVVAAPVVEAGTGTGKVEAPQEEEDYNKIFTVVQIEAEFPGGRAQVGINTYNVI
jgi:protein TonB